MSNSDKNPECLSTEVTLVEHASNRDVDGPSEISKCTLPLASGDLPKLETINHNSMKDDDELKGKHFSQDIGKTFNNSSLVQDEQTKEKDQSLSPLNIQRDEKKTILEEIDSVEWPFDTKNTENVSKPFSSPEDKEKDNSSSFGISNEHDKRNHDKENASMLHAVNFTAESKPENDFLEYQESYSGAQKSEDMEDHCLNDVVKNDPFSLSADEEFSPQTYKPIQRKISIRQEKPASAFKRCVSNVDDNDQWDTNIADAKDLSADCSPEKKKLKPCHRVAYIYSAEMVEKTNRLRRIEGRANLVHSLIQTYGLLQYIDVLEPRYATECEILGFHCPDYIDLLKGISDDDDDNSETVTDAAEDYGLSYDCPLQKDCFDTASLISGGTITAAEALCKDAADIAINWCGGWHHAKRDSASGFCYINDIVLGILKLRERFDKVLYIDIDLHHGDGVEEAFYMTPKVMTVSFHKLAPGFFPGSGKVEDLGTGRGKYHSINIPLSDGMKDSEFYFLFSKVMTFVREKFQPQTVVMQCGADTLAEDPMLSFNMTHIAIAKCVCFILTWNLPTLLLGGGGYHFANTAKCWTFITAMAAGKKLPVDIPEHENLLEYGPSYELTTTPGFRKNSNSQEYIRQLLLKVKKILSQI